MESLRGRLRDERQTLSDNFQKLLGEMAMIIGERVESIYFAFSMVEVIFSGIE
jgi:hypothetical protein